jgi:polyhydroxyalkanoate synthesis regulator phasin
MKLVLALLALALIAGGGAAIAGTGVLSPKQERQAFLDDAAKQLGVTPGELSAALKGALKKRVDAAVAAGRITKAEGDRVKARIDAGDVPLFLGSGLRRGPERFGQHDRGFRHRRGVHLEAAASYLGLTVQQLHDRLEGGKSLAQVAKQQGKSVAGLVQAMLAEKTKALDDAVKAGKLTKAERDDLVAGLNERITDLVNGRFPEHGHHEFKGRGASLPFPTI